MMQSKVKPLHTKVSETSSAVEHAVSKLSSMESKLTDLEERLKSLALAYEEASIDKCRQYELTETLDSQLSQAAYFEEVRRGRVFLFVSVFHMSAFKACVSLWLCGFFCSDVCCRVNKADGSIS